MVKKSLVFQFNGSPPLACLQKKWIDERVDRNAVPDITNPAVHPMPARGGKLFSL
jgi:hypothetical protein